MSKRPAATSDIRNANRISAERMAGLPPNAAALLRETARQVQAGKLRDAEVSLLRAELHAAEHPEALRWSGELQLLQGRPRPALDRFVRALAARPDDALLLCLLATAQALLGEDAASFDSLNKASALADDIETLRRLGMEFDRQGRAEQALAISDRALALVPDDAVSRLLRARCLQALGQAELAAVEYRRLIARKQHAASAWYALLDQKTIRIDGSELAMLEGQESAALPGSPDRTLLAFALGKAYEDAGQYEKAFATLGRANAYARAAQRWDAGAFSRHVEAVRAAFAQPISRAGIDHGGEVIFIVGLPRSGTTLIEQVLAAHPQVEGASELPYLDQIIADESRRRGLPFPQWVADARAEDWQRMGECYLRMSARWRQQRPIATDKLPANWLLAGAAIAMLPGAKFVGCQRDPVETCWSCYKQLFAAGQVGFAYDFESLAAYWRDCEHTCHYWATRYPARFRLQQYEALVAEPEAQVRDLLEFCGLPFDSSCLRFHQAQRSVRSASAAQVRQPLRRDTARTASYGSLLAPLRSLLIGEAREP